MALPVLPGKKDELKRFTESMSSGSKRRDFEVSETKLGIPKEGWFLQSSAQGGDYLIVYFEADDAPRSFTRFVQSKDPFDQWQKEQVKLVTGIDVNQVPPGAPLPEQLIAYGY